MPNSSLTYLIVPECSCKLIRNVESITKSEKRGFSARELYYRPTIKDVWPFYNAACTSLKETPQNVPRCHGEITHECWLFGPNNLYESPGQPGPFNGSYVPRNVIYSCAP